MQVELIDYVWAFLISFVVFMSLDFLWLGWVAKDIYGKQLKNKLKSPINWPVAVFFYFLFVIGLNYFAIVPALRDESLVVAAVSGFLFGFFTYATYDLTNYVTLKSWPRKIVFIDISWGSILSLSASVISYNLYIGIFGQ